MVLFDDQLQKRWVDLILYVFFLFKQAESSLFRSNSRFAIDQSFAEYGSIRCLHFSLGLHTPYSIEYSLSNLQSSIFEHPHTQNTTHNTQHTTHNTQHTTHNTQHTTHNTQNTTHNTANSQPPTSNQKFEAFVWFVAV